MAAWKNLDTLASYGELSETYACGASTCLLVKIINYALKYSTEFIEIE